MKFVRMGTAVSSLVLGLTVVVAAPVPSAEAAGCGFLGLATCPPPTTTPPPITTGGGSSNPPGNGDQPYTAGTVSAPFNSKDCGAPVRATTNRNWICTFADQFDGTTLNRSRWIPSVGFPSGNPNGNWACYVDRPDNIAVSSSTLHLVVQGNPLPTYCRTMARSTYYTSGMVSTWHLFSQASGRFQIRMKVTKIADGPGLQEAFWLWPDDRYVHMNWPTTGEIDIAETYSWKPSLAIPYLHYGPSEPGPRSGINTARNCVAHRGDWNVYTLTWRPDSLTIQVNGRTCLVNRSNDPAFRNRYIINLTSALGGQANSYVANNPHLRAVTSIDYVRAWK